MTGGSSGSVERLSLVGKLRFEWAVKRFFLPLELG